MNIHNLINKYIINDLLINGAFVLVMTINDFFFLARSKDMSMCNDLLINGYSSSIASLGVYVYKLKQFIYNRERKKKKKYFGE